MNAGNSRLGNSVIQLVLVTLLAFVLSPQHATAQSTLTSLDAIRDVELAADERRKVDFEATVTFVEPTWNFCFVSDGEHKIFVTCDDPEAINAASRVRIQGTLRPGDTEPLVSATSVEEIGQGDLPEPKPIDIAAIKIGEHDCDYISIEGEVLQILIDSRSVQLYCKQEDTNYFVHIPQWDVEPSDVMKFVGQQVRFTGNLGLQPLSQAFAEPGNREILAHKLFAASTDSLSMLSERVGIVPGEKLKMDALTESSKAGRFQTLGQVALVDHGPQTSTIVAIHGDDEAAQFELASAFDVHVGMLVRIFGNREQKDDGSIRLKADLLNAFGYSELPNRELQTVSDVVNDFKRNRRIKVEGQPVEIFREDQDFYIELTDGKEFIDVKLSQDAANPEAIEAFNPRYTKRVRAVGIAMPAERDGSRAAYQLSIMRDGDMEFIERDFTTMWIATAGCATLVGAFLLSMLWVRTLKKRVAEATAAANQGVARLVSSYDALEDGILAITTDSQAIAVNDEFRRIADTKLDIGDSTQTTEDHIASRVRNPDEFREFWRKSNSDPKSTDEILLELGETPMHVVMRTAPISLPNQAEPIGRLIIARDETERRALQTELLHSNKLEAVGRLVGGVAHDFNNVLMAIMANLSMAKFDKEASVGDISQELTIAEEAAQRGADIVRRLLTFSRKRELELKPHHINSIIDHLRELVRHLFGANYEFEFQLDETDPVVSVDSTAIEQVLLNLYVNAKDAMPAGGTILTVTKVVTNHAINRDVVLISVFDEGTGISPNLEDKIFDPFFTTKGERGTGLGLSTSFRIMQQHRGSLQHKRPEGKGSEFQIVLPLEKDSQVPDPGTDHAIPTSNETILVVDDEDVVRAVTVAMLRRHGYRTISAANGEEAIAAMERGAENVDCMLLDLMMPGMSGREVLEVVKRKWPNLPILMCSAYLPDDITDDANPFRADGKIAKPYTMRQLVYAVSNVLSAKADAVD